MLVSAPNLKTNIPGFSISSWESCPGRSEFCGNCYGLNLERQYKQSRSKWLQNWIDSVQDDFVPRMLKEIKAGPFRIHVTGDFYSSAYIQKWIEIVTRKPRTQFWTYTRSWRVPHLLPDLQQLWDLPNIQLFASLDDTILELPPDGWRVGEVHGRSNRCQGIVCLEQKSVMDKREKIHCSECKICFQSRKSNVRFYQHR